MSEGFSETSSTNFFQRMGKSLVGALIGIVLFFVSFIVLFWNESRAVDTAQALKEAGGAVIEVSSDKVDAANNDKLVHLSGEATTDEVLVDDLFPSSPAVAVPSDKVDPANNGKFVSVAGDATTDEVLTDNLFPVSAKALRFERKVEMFQWKEVPEEDDTYTYVGVWSSTPIDSQKFHDRKYRGQNPPMPFQGKTQTAKVVKLGAFELPPALLAKVDKLELLPATDDDAKKAKGAASEFAWKNANGVLRARVPKNTEGPPNNNPSPPAPVAEIGEIGDLKVSFYVIKPQKVSVLADQKDNTFVPYPLKSGGGSVFLLKLGDGPSGADGVAAKAIKLMRKVEMYQYKEESKTETHNNPVGGGKETKTTYTYHPVWSSTPIDSQNFHDPKFKGKNPPMPFQSKTQTAKVVKLGAFELSPELVNQIDKSEPLPVTEDDAHNATGDAGNYHWKSTGGILSSGDTSNPKIGDLKVSYSVVKPQKVSVMAAQRNNTFAAYQPKSASHQINLLKVGDHTAQAMISEQEALNTSMTWILRLVGFICMAVGIFLVLAPMAEFANILPFLGGFVSGGISFVLGVFAVLVAAVLSLITIAIAWLFYRPLLACGLLAGAAVFVVLIVMLVRRARPAARQA
jgi:hypothetical protein